LGILAQRSMILLDGIPAMQTFRAGSGAAIRIGSPGEIDRCHA